MDAILIILSFIYTFVLSLNYILGSIGTPSWLVYLGTVHHPKDYFYYLSQFAQGGSRWFTTVDLYTSEAIKPSLVGWTNVLMGKLLSVVGVAPILAYQIALALITLVFFLLVAYVLTVVFPLPSQKSTRYIACILFFLANTFANAPSFFANVFEPMTRFVRVPHQELGLICIILAILIIPKLQSKSLSLNHKIVHLILLIFSSLTLASINPIQWALVSLVFLISLLWHTKSFSGLSSLIVFVISGLPMILYLQHLFQSLPFSHMAAWESLQQVTPSLMHTILGFGPVALIAIMGIPLISQRLTLTKTMCVVYFVLSIGLFLSPLASLAHTTNTRFLSAITVLGACVIAAQFLTGLPIPSSKTRMWVGWILTGILVIYFVPIFVLQFKARANLSTGNKFIYILKAEYQAIMETKKRTTDRDIILATWPLDGIFPALTGRHGFMGHELLTINFNEKTEAAYNFLDARVKDDAMHEILTENGITYVLAYNSTTKIVKPFLRNVYQNEAMTLYKVLP